MPYLVFVAAGGIRVSQTRLVLNRIYFMLSCFITAHVPKYSAVFFPEEKTTSIIPTTKITRGELEPSAEVTVNWSGNHVSATIIQLSGNMLKADSKWKWANTVIYKISTIWVNFMPCRIEFDSIYYDLVFVLDHC